MAKAKTKPTSTTADAGGKKYLSQSDVPSWELGQAQRVPQAIADSYRKSPTKPLRVAEAMNMSPGSSHFRQLCGAAIAYGLTEGGYNSDLISLTPLGRRIVAPTREGDDIAARREALLRPRVIREFLSRYSGSRLPTDQIARNVLEEMGVPPGRTLDVFTLIVEGAKSLGFLREVKGQTYVDIQSQTDSPDGPVKLIAEDSGVESIRRSDDGVPAGQNAATPKEEAIPRSSGRVFITHGRRNSEIVGQLKDLLMFGGFTPIIALEQETVSKPVPDKVMDDMRSCDAAIIHVGTDLKLMAQDGKEHKMLNQNVLIEIGAAMALYDRKFILLVEKGTSLPSNLQGLYEVRYEGEKLDYESTMKLLKAFNDFRS